MSQTVLVIDDEPPIVTYLTTVLEDHGFKVLSATDAKAGFEIACDQVPEAICLDIMMPKRSGIALFQDLRLDPRTQGVPIVFVSAFSHLHDLRNPELFRKFVSNEQIPKPEACVDKPINVTQFIHKVISVIDSASGTQEPNEGRSA